MRKMKILVVDDNEKTREIVKELLLYLGHQAQATARGIEAIAMLKHLAPDIVITDRRMSGMSGEELIRRIKESLPHLPIILMTADFLSIAERRVIAAAGASSILSKPFSEEELERALDEVVRISPL